MADTPSQRAGIIDRTLNAIFGISTWKQALILVSLGLAGLVGYIVWEYRERFVAAFEELVRTPPAAAVNEKRIPEVAAKLLYLPHVVAVTIWTADCPSNRRWLVGWAANGDAAKAWFEKHAPRYETGCALLRLTPGGNYHVIQAINGDVGCGPPDGYPDEITGLASIGINAECIIGIPPESGTYAGAIYVGLDRVLTESERESIRAPMWTAAQQLTRE